MPAPWTDFASLRSASQECGLDLESNNSDIEANTDYYEEGTSEPAGRLYLVVHSDIAVLRVDGDLPYVVDDDPVRQIRELDADPRVVIRIMGE